MKATGMIRPVDKMGRVVIPKEIRAKLQVVNDSDSFEIFMDDDRIILKKYRPACIFCNSLGDCVEYGEYVICKECVDKLYELKCIDEN